MVEAEVVNPPRTPSPSGAVHEPSSALVRTKPFGHDARPMVDQLPFGPLFAPHSAMTTRPVAGSVMRQKYPCMATP